MVKKNQTKNSNKKKAKKLEKLKWKFALKNSNIGVWHWDNSTNEDIVFYSKESKHILGFKDDDNFGINSQDWNDRVHPEDKEKYFKDFQDHLNGIYPIYKNKHRVLCKDGSYKWILDKGKIIEKDKNGKPIRVVGTHTDITALVEDEIKQKNTLDILTKQNKKLQNFAHVVSHNLKQHSGNFESLLGFYDEAKNDSEKEELIEYLKTLSSSLNTTIKNLNEIVSFESKKEIDMKKLFLTENLEKVLKLLNVIITEHNVTVNNFIDDNIFIYFSQSYLESIVLNLLTNAIKYKHPDRDPVINVSYSIVGNNIFLNVSDNGIGINLDKYGDSIFGLYKTFHNNEDSEGVGLYLVKNQVESFGGKIDVSSEVNAGTTFTVTIPNKKIQ